MEKNLFRSDSQGAEGLNVEPILRACLENGNDVSNGTSSAKQGLPVQQKEVFMTPESEDEESDEEDLEESPLQSSKIHNPARTQNSTVKVTFQPPSSGLRLPCYSLMQPPPGLRFPSSSPRPTSSGLRFPSFPPRPPASGLRFPSSSLRPPPSGLRFLSAPPRPPASGLRFPSSSPRPPPPDQGLQITSFQVTSHSTGMQPVLANPSKSASQMYHSVKWFPRSKPRWIPPPRAQHKPVSERISAANTGPVVQPLSSPNSGAMTRTAFQVSELPTAEEQDQNSVHESSSWHSSSESLSMSPESSQSSENTSWSWNNDDSFAETSPLEFMSELSFVDIPTGENVELNCFLEYLTEEILELIVNESNKYFQEVTGSKPTLSRRDKDFKNFAVEDILRMVATRICMGIDQKPSQASYWSSNPFYKSEIVRKIMTSDRYKEVMQYLHFCDNAQQRPGDRIHKIRKIWNLFNERLGFFCNPGKNLCVDESLVGFKGRLGFRQYVPSKAAKIGIKLFCIGDSESGHILNAVIYEGKGHVFDYSTEDFGFGGAVALHMAAPYLNWGRCIFADNFFVNARLAQELLTVKTNLCGTLRRNLKLNPKMDGKISKGTAKVYSCNGVLVERWKDKKEVCIMSTGHHHQMASVRTKWGTIKQKPVSALEYNKLSRAIDKMDMVTSTYDMNRKCAKWYKKLFFKMLDICLYNANIRFGRTHGVIPILEFKERVVLQILKKYGEHEVKRGRRPSEATQKRFTERHFIDYIPSTEKKEKPSRSCIVCNKNGTRRETRNMCPDCGVPLCIVSCFKLYHKR